MRVLHNCTATERSVGCCGCVVLLLTRSVWASSAMLFVPCGDRPAGADRQPCLTLAVRSIPLLLLLLLLLCTSTAFVHHYITDWHVCCSSSPDAHVLPTLTVDAAIKWRVLWQLHWILTFHDWNTFTDRWRLTFTFHCHSTMQIGSSIDAVKPPLFIWWTWVTNLLSYVLRWSQAMN